MSDEVAEKAKQVPVKELPNNNKEQHSEPEMANKPEPQTDQPQTPPQPAPQQPMPDSFTISKQGVDELVQALNEVVASKFVKQVLFNVVNEHFKPVFDKK